MKRKKYKKYKREFIISIIAILFGIAIILVNHFIGGGIEIKYGITDLDLLAVIWILGFMTFCIEIYKANKR